MYMYFLIPKGFPSWFVNKPNAYFLWLVLNCFVTEMNAWVCAHSCYRKLKNEREMEEGGRERERVVWMWFNIWEFFLLHLVSKYAFMCVCLLSDACVWEFRNCLLVSAVKFLTHTLFTRSVFTWVSNQWTLRSILPPLTDVLRTGCKKTVNSKRN